MWPRFRQATNEAADMGSPCREHITVVHVAATGRDLAVIAAADKSAEDTGQVAGGCPAEDSLDQDSRLEPGLGDSRAARLGVARCRGRKQEVALAAFGGELAPAVRRPGFRAW